MQEQDALNIMRNYIRNTYRFQKVAAEHWGVSSAFLSYVLAGKKTPPDHILKEIGLQRKVVKRVDYEWREDMSARASIR